MKSKVWFAVGIIVGNILCVGSVRAMAIVDFVRMNLDDQATYVTAMVEGSAKKLRADGHPDQAQKVIALFKNNTKQGGVNQLAMNMKSMQLQNIQNADNPNNRMQVYDVESAMAQTLHDNGVEMPVNYLETINRDFRPMFPLRSHLVGQ